MTTALVVIDMLNDFLTGGLANPAAGRIVDPIAKLVERARARDEWVVVYANDAHQPDDVELTVWPPHAMAGTPGAQVVDALRPEPDDVVIGKRFYSAFTDTELEPVLRQRGVDRLVLTGQHTDCCLRHTSYDAFRRGVRLAVCPDASTVFEPGSDEPVSVRQQRALDYLVAYYGVALVPWGEVL
jgi:nicotinamidase-related amidase